MCHFNKLFVKRSLGTGNSSSDTELINTCLTIIEIDDKTYGAVELNIQIVSGIVSVSDIVRVMLVSVNSDQINREKVPY